MRNGFFDKYSNYKNKSHEWELERNFGKHFEEKINNFKRFSVLHRKNEEVKNFDSSSSSEGYHIDYYEDFLKRLHENNENEIYNTNHINKKKVKSSSRKNRHSVIENRNLNRSSILKNKKFRTMLRQSLIKHNHDILKSNTNKEINNKGCNNGNNDNNNNINNNNNNDNNNDITNNNNEVIIKLTPINEEKSVIKQDKNKKITKVSKKSNNLSIKSSIESKNSKDFNEEINSILKDVSKDQSLISNKKKNFNKRLSMNNMRSSFSHNSNLIDIVPYKTSNFSSIKSKKPHYKVSESYIKNCKSEKVRKKEKKHNLNNSLEDNNDINNHKTNLFNPQKIEIESFMNKNNNTIVNEDNKEKEKEKEFKEEDVNINNEKIVTPSQGSFKINVKKKRCLFCCIPLK